MAKKTTAIASPDSSDFRAGVAHACERITTLIGQGVGLSEAVVIITDEASAPVADPAQGGDDGSTGA